MLLIDGPSCQQFFADCISHEEQTAFTGAFEYRIDRHEKFSVWIKTTEYLYSFFVYPDRMTYSR